MLDKKSLLIVIFFLSILFVSILLSILIYAQETPSLPYGVDKLQNISEKLTDEEARRQYLSQEWKEILLKNKIVATLDSFFTKNSIVFRILFGMPYSLSLTLFFVIVFWLFIAIGTADLTRKGLGILEGVAYILGIVSAVILAQLQILKGLSTFLIKFIFYPEAAWARFIVFVLVIAILIIIYYFKSALSQALEQRRKKLKEEETEQKQKELKKVTQGLEKGIK